MTQITRKQAWCKLAVLIADGLPAPRDIDFYEHTESGSWINIYVDDASALHRWSDQIGAELVEPRIRADGVSWRQQATARSWNGWLVDLCTNNASSYGDSDGDGMAAVRAIAATDIPGEGEEVAGPAEGSGSATAPAETAAGSDPCPADEAPNAGTPESGGVSAAVPAPVVTGDGAAVAPSESEPWPTTSKHANGFRAPEVVEEMEREDPTMVWVPIRRRGINFHPLAADDRYTVCGRAARTTAGLIPLTEAEAFGAVPCPRCYRGAA